MKKIFYFILLFLICLHGKGQSSLGVSGLLTAPSADMQADGTFMAGGNYLPKSMLTDDFRQNTGNYFLNITFLPFVEVGYRCTLAKGEGSDLKETRQQDRAVSLRLRILKEKKYLPSVVLGSNDAFTTYALNPFSNKKANRMFGSIYGVVTKNIPMGNHILGITGGYYIPVYEESPNEGFFGGIRYTPGFLPQVSVIADYNRKKMSAGASLLLFNHFRIQVMTYGFKDLSTGIRYEFLLIRKRRQS
ncbi:YjbH domain-containing protein [Parabacteroides sp.]